MQDKWEIPRENLSIKRLVGDGEYGVVFEASLKTGWTVMITTVTVTMTIALTVTNLILILIFINDITNKPYLCSGISIDSVAPCNTLELA